MYAIVFQFSRICGIRENAKMVVAVGVYLQTATIVVFNIVADNQTLAT